MTVDEVDITLTDLVSQVLPESSSTYLYFRLPVLSSSPSVTTKKVSLCLQAIDYHFATTSKCT